MDAVLCARGGYGGQRMADLLDREAMRAAGPKAFAGFSDITAPSQAPRIWDRCRFHSLSPASRDPKRAMSEVLREWRLSSQRSATPKRRYMPWTPVHRSGSGSQRPE